MCLAQNYFRQSWIQSAPEDQAMLWYSGREDYYCDDWHPLPVGHEHIEDTESIWQKLCGTLPPENSHTDLAILLDMPRILGYESPHDSV